MAGLVRNFWALFSIITPSPKPHLVKARILREKRLVDFVKTSIQLGGGKANG